MTDIIANILLREIGSTPKVQPVTPSTGLGAMTSRKGITAPQEEQQADPTQNIQRPIIDIYRKIVQQEIGDGSGLTGDKIPYDPLVDTPETLAARGYNPDEVLRNSVFSSIISGTKGRTPKDKVLTDIEDLIQSYEDKRLAKKRSISKERATASSSILDVLEAELRRGMTSKQTDTQPTVSADSSRDRFELQGDMRDLPVLDDEDAPEVDTRSNELLDKELPSDGLGSRPALTDDDMGLPDTRSTEEQSVAAEQYLNENLYSTDAPINVSNMQISGTNFSDRNSAIDEVARGLSNTYTDEEVAALKATISRESGIGLIEGTNYSRDVAIAKLGNNDTTRIAEINSLFDRSNAGDRLDASQQEELLNIAYGGRMGNANNEGYKYRGRGLIQITGKNHYRDVSERLGLGDLLVTNPELVATDPAIMVAATKAYLDMKGFGSDSLSANSLKDTIGHSGGALEAEIRWTNTIEDLRTQGKDSLADELVLNNEFAAQRKAGTTVDGDIGPNSRGAFERWLTEAGVSFSDDASDLELVRLVNSN